jgi:hypothetical protein
MGWAGMTAAKLEVTLNVAAHTVIEGIGGSTGLARALYKVDFHYLSHLYSSDLSLIKMDLTEKYQSIRVENTLRPEPKGIRAHRWGIPPDKPEKERFYPRTDALDLFGGLILLRSRPLKDGDTENLLVCHGDRLYVAEVRILGREERNFAVGRRKAIKLDLALKKIGKKGIPEQSKKLQKAVGWISDDIHRDLLLIESEVFFGSVFAELRSKISPPASVPQGDLTR